MSNAFSLWGELKADTGKFESSMRSSQNLLESVSKAVTSTESRAVSLGKTTATTSRQFERFNEVLSAQQKKLLNAGAAFQAGHISAKQMASVMTSVDSSLLRTASSLKSVNAGLDDFKKKAVTSANTKNLKDSAKAQADAAKQQLAAERTAAKTQAAADRIATKKSQQLASFRSDLEKQGQARQLQKREQDWLMRTGRGTPGGSSRLSASSMFGGNEFLAGATGGLVGGGVAMAGLAAFGATKQLASGIANLGGESVRMAADFQMTQNAMAVFTGSTEKAKIELRALADLSRKTPGLGLEDAEKGATRLRAMGFSAATATKLLTGLAKQKILSGVGSEAIDRVTLNLAQLASGGGDFQDIKDLVQNLPTARKEINAAFGSLQGFQTALKANPQAAIQKFADALANVQAPAGGFNDALQKLNDSFLVTGRAFGSPILDPLTDGMKNLTAIVSASEGTWSSWGTTVGNQIRAVNGAISGLAQIDAATGGRLSSSISALIGQVIRQQLPTASAVLGLTETAGRVLGNIPGQAKASIGGNASGFDSADSKINLEKAKEDAIKLIEIQAAARKENQNQLTAYYGYISNLNSSAFKIQEAQLANHLSKQEASEMQSIRANAALKEQQIRAQQRTDAAYFKGALSMAVPGEQAAIQQKANEAFANSNAELVANAQRAAIAIREAMKKAKTDIASIFISGFKDNPFVSIFDQGRLAIERVREATQGLNPHLRAMLLTLTAGATATAAFGQSLENKLQASNLRNEARQFAAGKLDADTPENFQKNLDRQLASIGATGNALGRTPGEQRLIDKQIIALTQGLDPAKLSRSQQQLASTARLEEAKRLDTEQEEARLIQKKLLTVLTNLEGNKALEILIDDPNNRTSIAATSSNVNARYPNR